MHSVLIWFVCVELSLAPPHITELQAYFRDIGDSVPGHCYKASHNLFLELGSDLAFGLLKNATFVKHTIK